MSPVINKGEKIAVEGRYTLENGDMVAVSIDGNVQTVMCRKLQKHDETALLLPYNKNYDPTVFDSKRMKILGKVTAVTKPI